MDGVGGGARSQDLRRVAAREGTAPPSFLHWAEGNKTRQGRGGVERWQKCVFSPGAG